VSVISDIEDAVVEHWSLLGLWPGAKLVDEGGILRFETPISALPYNAVLRTRLDGDVGPAIGSTLAGYAARGVDVMWFVGPSARPNDLGDRLVAAGLPRIEVGTGMALELADVPARPVPELPGVAFAEVVDDEGLDNYLQLNLDYWGLSEEQREPVSRLNRHWAGERARGKRFLAHADGAPVGKGYVSFAGPPGVAAIFGMAVRTEARGRGIASAMTQLLVETAQEAGAHRVVLMASEMAVGVYARLGFVGHCTIDVHATGTLWARDG
jgi:GNAT superfamily N-acetyltransferase